MTMHCPHCAGSINPEVVAKIIDQQRTVMTLRAEDGGPLTARAVGAAISGTAAIDREGFRMSLTRRQFLARQARGRKRILLAPKGQKHIRQAEQAALLRDQLAAEMAGRRK